MKTIHEFTEMEWKRFNKLLEQAYNLIDWTSVNRTIDIYNSEGPSDEFWEIYSEAVAPIADPYAVLLESGVEIGTVEYQMLTDMAEDVDQNPGNELKYWSHCQDSHWDLFCKIVDILKKEGY